MQRLYIFLILLIFSVKIGAQSDTLIIKKLMDEAFSLELSHPDKALSLYKKTQLLSFKDNYKEGVYKSLMYSGLVHAQVGNYDSAYYYYTKTIEYSKKEKILVGEGKGYINLANMYQFKGDYNNAIKYYLQSINIFEKLKDSSIISKTYQNLSAVYSQYNNNDLEFLYLNRALQFVPKQDIAKKGTLYGDIGLGYLRQNKLDEAYESFKKSEVISTIEPNHELMFYVTRNFGEYYRFKKEFNKAIPYYEKVYKDHFNTLDMINKNDLMYIMGELYYQTGNYDKALHFSQQSIEIANKIDSDLYQYKTLKTLSDIYSKRNQPEKAYHYLAESYSLKDSVFTKDHMQELNMLQTQFETEKKDRSIAEQQAKLNEQELKLIRSKKEKEIYFIISLSFILISMGIYFSFKQRQKIKNNEIINLKQQQDISKLEALIEGEEKERKRIAQELHDGLNGDLSAIKYRLTAFEESGLSPLDAENLNKVICMIDDSCAQVRNISHDLMPSSILDFGLIETIREYCLKINHQENFDIDFQTFGNYIALSKKTETVIYRIIQELVTNILKHAQATEAMVQFNYREDELFITVEDNGIGFDKNAVSKGIGHQNIKTRIDFLNAQMNVDTSSAGTSYTISIDLNKVK